MATAVAQVEQLPREVRARRALWGAILGFFVDMFDVYLPIAVLAPAITYFIPSELPAVVQATIFYVVFAVTLIARPLGSVIFGHFADVIGRRKVTLICIAGFSLATFLMAVLPGYGSTGYLAVVLLVVLRFLAGLFIGGEYTAANPLAMEYAPKEKRGLYGAMIHTGYPAALLAITALTAIMLKIAPAGGPASEYARWGWRIPFLIGVLLSAERFFFYLRQVPESDVWEAASRGRRERSPLRTLFQGSNLKLLLRLFVLMTGAWLTLNATVGALPGLAGVLQVQGSAINTGTLIAATLGVLVFPFLGMLSQKWGRRPTITLIGLMNTLLGGALYFALVRGGYQSPTALVWLVAAVCWLSLLIWAVHTPYLVEHFRTEIRSAGYGVSYSAATIIPGFYSFYMLGLSRFMPYAYTPVLLLVVGGLFLALGALTGPETRDVDLHTPA